MSSNASTVVSQEPINVATMPLTNPQGVSTIYANNVGLAATLMDFTLIFCETGQLPGEKGLQPKNELRAAVTLPMPAAAALIQILAEYLKKAQEQAKVVTESARIVSQGSGLQ